MPAVETLALSPAIQGLATVAGLDLPDEAALEDDEGNTRGYYYSWSDSHQALWELIFQEHVCDLVLRYSHLSNFPGTHYFTLDARRLDPDIEESCKIGNTLPPLELKQ
jgi:hypothetical protein